MIKRKEEMNVLNNVNMKGGDGTVKIVKFMEQEEINGKCRLMAKIILEPGCSIGKHMHNGEEEIFYIIKGTAEYDDNGSIVTLNEGDSCVCLGGEEHSIANRTDSVVELIAFIPLYSN